MNAEELLQLAKDALSGNPELARRHQEMRALLDRAQTVADLVQAYKVGCITSEASPRQIKETEQAIYAACSMLLQVLMSNAAEGHDVQSWVVGVMQECSNYASGALINN